MTLLDGRLRTWSDGSGYSNYGRRIDPDDDYIPFALFFPELVWNIVQPDNLVPLALPCDSPPVVLTRMRLP